MLADKKPLIAIFLSKVYNLREQHQYDLELIINFDETPIFFDTIPNYCYVEKDIKRVEVKTSCLHKKRVTAGLGITAAGYRLRLILIFKGEGEGFRKFHNTEGIVVKKNSTAWMKEEFFQYWMRNELKFFLERKRKILNKPHARTHFIIDRFSKEIEDLGREMNMDILFIPAGATSSLQPLELRVNRRMKDNLKGKVASILFSN